MVSNTGLIKSLHWGKEKLLKQVIRSNNYPYYFVGLLKDGKRKYFAIHRLVAMMFIPNPNNYEQIDHLDGNKLNNNVENLEWVTAKENQNHATRIGLRNNIPKGEKHPNYGKCGEKSKSAKPVIRKDPKTGEIKLYKAKILAKDDGFDITSISKCCHGKLKTHKGYEWYFAKDSDKEIV
jgi:hypothetical protein